MKTYIAREPKVIEAYQNTKPLHDLVRDARGKMQRIEPGEWAIAEPGHPGRFYPCDDETFKKLYKEVE